MATVTGFESLTHPTKSELRQFAELFTPLFQASSDEARRQAVAALSQCANVPEAVALFIASQPISVAAPFLASSPCLSDDLLIMVAKTQGLAHARAIVRRENLSPKVIDALVDLRHERRPEKARPVPQADAAATPPVASVKVRPTPAADVETARQAREEVLRQTIKSLANQLARPSSDRLGLLTVTPMQEALLVRFARNRETGLFASTLSDALSASRWLAERILLDISGRQLAVTLVGLGMEPEETVAVLTDLYPQLSAREGIRNRAINLVAELDPVECEERIEAWRKADSYTFPKEGAAPALPAEDAQPMATSPAKRAAARLAGDEHARVVLRQRRG
ncbi:DUF2336 domain-containing protein [Ciceribacter sp. L1K23]|nr:DUF2336 domain-containing protein [Ciceribacter sp. L1K23]MBR0556527.1 DUF2336 domain-containing protein [Ciceribacter sp. L1K23]